MTLSVEDRRLLFEQLADPSGGLCMIAMDQRESLRTMFGEATGETVPDATLSAFKLAVSEILSPHASAMLLDRQWGAEAVRALDPKCALIEAADKLTQEPGGIVEDTDLDPAVDPLRARDEGAVALKLLLLWRPDDDPDARRDLVRRFVEAAHRGGLLALLEGVVRPPRGGDNGWDREAAVLDAARELSPLDCDIYKAEVPLRGKGDAAAIEERCRMMSEVIPCPWVVLSQGVSVDDFPRAVEAACRGGASGFLAGRAVWSDVVGAGYREGLARVSVPRLDALRSTVQRLARPWWEVTP